MGKRKDNVFMRNDRDAVGNGGWLLWCENCGRSAFLVLPLPMTVAIAAANAFNKDHRRCTLPKGATPYEPPPARFTEPEGGVSFSLGFENVPSMPDSPVVEAQGTVPKT